MGGFREYARYDGLGLAELVRKKKVSPAELCEEAIARIEALNPDLNAVVHRMYDEARKAAKGPLPKGPFAGVPFLLKDLLAACAGAPLTSGSRAFRDYVPDHDSELVQRFRNAGLIIMGKTNTPEFGLMGITEPELFGPARNPWDRERTPGGSSGGSAAAVASGMVPLASGGDGGGSIRIPASYCGLFGLKPSRGRNPVGPDSGQFWQGAAVEHVLTRSVRDSAALLDATRGAAIGDRYAVPHPKRPYMKEITAKPGKLKVAFSTASPIGRKVDPECVAAVHGAARLLEDLGHRVEEAAPGIDGVALARSYLTMYYGETAADMAAAGELLGRKPRGGDFELTTRILGLLGRTYTAEDFVLALREWDRAARAMACFHETYDLYLTPTVASPPVRIGELAPKAADRIGMTVINGLGLGGALKKLGVAEELAFANLERTPFTQMANLTGQPAMSVPLHWTAGGLPLGVQFIAPRGDEGLLFRLAAQLEKAAPWFDRRPPIL